MFGQDAMIKMGLTKLGEWLKSQGGTIELSENQINDFIADKNQPFSILCFDDDKKGKVIKLIYSGE